MADGLRVGVFGGTFDPPHLGHLVTAQDVAEAADLDRVLWVPANRPPHKQEEPLTSGLIRGEMVRAAIRGDPVFRFSDVELDRSGVSYTVDTLRWFKREHPDWSLSLLVGADQVADLHGWREPDEIGRLAEIMAVSRDGKTPVDLDVPEGVRVRGVPTTRVDISASEIRRRIARRQSIRYMVPDAVIAIIEREQLYRS